MLLFFIKDDEDTAKCNICFGLPSHTVSSFKFIVIDCLIELQQMNHS